MTAVSEQLKLDVTIPAEGGIELGAWLFLPEGDGIRPAITMAHGFGGTKEHGLERFALAFAAVGFVVLVHILIPILISFQSRKLPQQDGCANICSIPARVVREPLPIRSYRSI